MGKKRRNPQTQNNIPSLMQSEPKYNNSFPRNTGGPGLIAAPLNNNRQFGGSWQRGGYQDSNRNFNASNQNISVNSFGNYSNSGRPTQLGNNSGFGQSSNMMQQFSSSRSMSSNQNTWNSVQNFEMRTGTGILGQSPHVRRSDQEYNRFTGSFKPSTNYPAFNNFSQDRHQSLPQNFSQGIVGERPTDFQRMHSKYSFNASNQNSQGVSSLLGEYCGDSQRTGRQEHEHGHSVNAKITELNKKLWNVETTLDAKTDQSIEKNPKKKKKKSKRRPLVYRIAKMQGPYRADSSLKEPFRRNKTSVNPENKAPFPPVKINDNSFSTINKAPYSSTFSNDSKPGPSHANNYAPDRKSFNNPAWANQINQGQSSSATFNNQSQQSQGGSNVWARSDYNTYSRPTESSYNKPFPPPRSGYMGPTDSFGQAVPFSGRGDDSMHGNQGGGYQPFQGGQNITQNQMDKYHWKRDHSDSELDDDDLRFQLLSLKQQKIEEQLQELDRKSKETERKLSMFENNAPFLQF